MRPLLALAGLLVFVSTPAGAGPLGASGVSFAPAQLYPAGPRTSPNAVAVGDLNGDGKPDLVTANWDANSVSVFLNKGDGAFQPGQVYPTGPITASVVFGDLDGDGEQDLATANHGLQDTVSVLLNRGDGTFEPKRDYAGGLAPWDIAIGDLNGDEELDLAVANQNSTVSALINRGDGTFSARVGYRTRGTPHSVGIGDLNVTASRTWSPRTPAPGPCPSF
jgi:hypothetical protein